MGHWQTFSQAKVLYRWREKTWLCINVEAKFCIILHTLICLGNLLKGLVVILVPLLLAHFIRTYQEERQKQEERLKQIVEEGNRGIKFLDDFRKDLNKVND